MQRLYINILDLFENYIKNQNNSKYKKRKKKKKLYERKRWIL